MFPSCSAPRRTSLMLIVPTIAPSSTIANRCRSSLRCWSRRRWSAAVKNSSLRVGSNGARYSRLTRYSAASSSPSRPVSGRITPDRSCSVARCVHVGRPALEDPLRVQRPALVGAAVDLDEVPRLGIHRQARLGGEVAVVPVDELVHLREAPALGRRDPEALELVAVVDVERQLPPRVLELALVACELVLDRAQPPHPDRRPAETAN